MDAETEFKSLAGKLRDAVERVDADKLHLGSRLTEVEQKMARRGLHSGASGLALKTFGGAIVDSQEFKELASSGRKGKIRATINRSEIETKAVISNPAISSASGSAGGLITPDYRLGSIVELPRQALPVRALLGQSETTSNVIFYPRQVSRTNNAAPVPELQQKPQSDATFADVQVPVRTIAHWFRCSRQIMDDAAAFRSFINDEATFGLKLVEETQFLFGDGTGQNLTGMVPLATMLSIPSGKATPGSDTAFDRIAFGMEQVVAASLMADGLIINPTDWIEMLRIKDGQGRYMSGGPFSADVINRIWNLNISATLSMPAGQFLIGSFMSNVRVYDRAEVEVMMSTEDQDNFVTNQVTILAEERTALTVLRPAGLVYGNLYG